MKNILLPAALLFTVIAHGQYYYNDIIGTAEIEARQKNFATHKVQLISASGWDAQNVKTDEYNELQEIKENGRKLIVFTRNIAVIEHRDQPTEKIITDNFVIHRFNAEGRLISLTDSSGTVNSVATYQYDNRGNLISIRTVTRDPATGFDDTELHQWIYNASNKPEKMFRILNGKDSTEIRFKTDESGNVIDEQMYIKGAPHGDPIYYYYDDQNRLLDIVRFYNNANRLLPDFMFEYGEGNRVLQKTTTFSAMRYAKGRPSLRLSYLQWRYTYDEKGLKIRETLWGKNKTRIGKIEYEYSFGQ